MMNNYRIYNYMMSKCLNFHNIHQDICIKEQLLFYMLKHN